MVLFQRSKLLSRPWRPCWACGVSEPGLVEEVGTNPCLSCWLGLPFTHPLVCLPDCPAILSLLPLLLLCARPWVPSMGMSKGLLSWGGLWGRVTCPGPCRTGAGLAQEGQWGQRLALWEPLLDSSSQACLSLSLDSVVCV